MEPLAEHGNDACQVGCARAQLSLQCLGVEVVKVGSEDLNKGLVWRSEGAFLVAMADE
jgi:hypothetical protein